MRSEQYKIISKDEKVKVVSKILAGTSLRNVEKKIGVAKSTIREWVANADINPDKEYALKYRLEHPWMDKWMGTSFDKKDHFTEEIPTTTTSNPEELKKKRKQRLEKENCLFRRQNYVLTNSIWDNFYKSFGSS